MKLIELWNKGIVQDHAIIKTGCLNQGRQTEMKGKDINCIFQGSVTIIAWTVAVSLLVIGCGDEVDKGNRLLELGSYQEAVAIAQKEVQENPDNSEAHMLLGRARVSWAIHGGARELFDQGIKEMETAMFLEPRDGDIPYILAALYSWNGDYKKYTEMAEKAMTAANPKFEILLYADQSKKENPVSTPERKKWLNDALALFEPAPETWRFPVNKNHKSTFIVHSDGFVAKPVGEGAGLPLPRYDVREFEDSDETNLYFTHRVYESRTGYVRIPAFENPTYDELQRQSIYNGVAFFGVVGNAVPKDKIRPGSVSFSGRKLLTASTVRYDYMTSSTKLAVARNSVWMGSGDVGHDMNRIQKVLSCGVSENVRDMLIRQGIAAGMPLTLLSVLDVGSRPKSMTIDRRGLVSEWESRLLIATVKDGRVVSFAFKGESEGLAEINRTALSTQPSTTPTASSSAPVAPNLNNAMAAAAQASPEQPTVLQPSTVVQPPVIVNNPASASPQIAPYSSAEVDEILQEQAEKANDKGMEELKDKNYQDAIKQFVDALTLYPGMVTARYNLACAYARNGQKDEAVARIEELTSAGCEKCLQRIKKAPKDSDFASLLHYAGFRKAVGLEEENKYLNGSPSLNPTIQVFKASSQMKNHPVEHAFDANPKTAWNENAEGNGDGEWIEATFDSPKHITAVRFSTGYNTISEKKEDLFFKNAHIKKYSVTFDGKNPTTAVTGEEERSVELSKLGITAKTIRITAIETYPGEKWEDLCLSEVEIFGETQ